MDKKKLSIADEKFCSNGRKRFQRLMSSILFWPYYKVFNNIKMNGRDNFTDGKPFILASNHISNHDPFIIISLLKESAMFMAKREMYDFPLLGGFLRALGSFAVNRKKLEVSTIKSARTAIKCGWTLAMFPQGTRRKYNEIGEVKEGFAFIAKSNKVDIIPVGITGSIGFGKDITVNVGEPISHELEVKEIVERWIEAVKELTGIEYKEDEKEIEMTSDTV